MKTAFLLSAACLLAMPLTCLAGESVIGCRAVSTIVEFCLEQQGEDYGDYSGWLWSHSPDRNSEMWHSGLPEEAVTMISVYQSKEAAQIDEQAAKAQVPERLWNPGGKIASKTDSLQEIVDTYPAETSVYTYIDPRGDLVYVYTWLRTDSALIQIFSLFVGPQFTTQQRGMHADILSAIHAKVK